VSLCGLIYVVRVRDAWC